MTMLSRVADRLYWMARYLERAEDTARLTQAYTHLIMDLPVGTELSWDILISILDAQPAYGKRYRVVNEQNVLKFLIADRDNPSSIISSIKVARENVRTTRDVLPEEIWEQMNELLLYADELAEKSVGRRNRHEFLEQVVTRSQTINGQILTSLSRDHAYRFIKMGRLLERADMTTRVIDVGAGAILGRQQSNPAIDPLLWASLLQALSAMGAYRRAIGPLAEPQFIVNFVFKEAALPRSVRFCLSGIREELKPLKNNTAALQSVESAYRKVSRFDAQRKTPKQLHDFIDRFQVSLNRLNDDITTTWFMPPQL